MKKVDLVNIEQYELDLVLYVADGELKGEIKVKMRDKSGEPIVSVGLTGEEYFMLKSGLPRVKQLDDLRRIKEIHGEMESLSEFTESLRELGIFGIGRKRD